MIHYLLCDLKNDPDLIAEYEAYHAAGHCWPEVTEGIRAAGIVQMEIYRTGNRLMMVMETDGTYTAERHAALNQASDTIQQWETLMDRFQQRLPFSAAGIKWVPMNKLFDLRDQ
ncbi:L-rhamnose mutarotase [Neolewinella xylanilytica]|uniref:L-rhamnose mutarotase n=1 Tax=Neolewinella xylanilytica TaxID=1514080 RepID=A0A2S6I3F7_9BACT|nr:L-rhamnose mutarotase [Neolewinella xylanilytica]PPK85690.1 L-rhamnose mutarotase [Neolewinella xylanilytica]